MLLLTLDGVGADQFADHTGWRPTAEGLCQGEICVPAAGSLRADGTVDVEIAAQRLGMPLLHDADHGVWALGPATHGGKALTTAAAADPELVTHDGQPFRLSSLHGRKVLLVAWSSY
ncbi:MAG: hypothetical protein LH616_19700 [Ilumatobacteraceae bacterium]|nr:hypothetical protein [Ilumatobacteraceae bacterium]